jgi:hypothetical protein
MFTSQFVGEESKEDGMYRPRTYDVLYNNILKKTPIRKRPPVAYYNMCAELPDVSREYRELQLLLEEKPAESDEELCGVGKDYEQWRWGKYATREAAERRKRHLGLLKRRREDHEVWYRFQRPAVTLYSLDC